MKRVENITSPLPFHTPREGTAQVVEKIGGPDRIRTYDLPLRRRGNFQQNQRLAGPTPDLISTVSATVTARALALVTDPERAAQAPLIARQRAWARLKEAREQREDAA